MKLYILQCCVILISLPFAFYINLTYLYHETLSYWSPLPYENGTEFDFIVVGSGTAGSVVAGRLTEAGYDVLLIEAGGPSHWMQGIPRMAGMFRLTSYDWQYKTVPQEHACFALKDKRSLWPRGKELGGTSMMNTYVYIRGHSKDYDEWEAMGNVGWGWRDVFPYFKKSEDYSPLHIYSIKYTGRTKKKDEYYHGKSGPMIVQQRPPTEPYAEISLDAAIELGFKIGDNNGDGEDESFFIHDESLKDNWRYGLYRPYCEKYYEEGKLSVLTFSHVTNILLDNEVTVGVEVSRFGKKLQYKAKKETVLSAGTVGSPQILMLSGIGPETHLKELGIQVVKNLPVGENLQDHILTHVTVTVNDSSIVTPILQMFNPASWFELFTNNSGMLLGMGLGALGLYKSSTSIDARPDLYMSSMGVSELSDYQVGYFTVMGINDTYRQNYQNMESKESFAIGALVNRPESIGNIRLQSKNPFDHPIIDPKYLSKRRDVDALIEGQKLIDRMIQTKAFALYSPEKIIDTVNCAEFDKSSDEYYECYARHRTLTVYHHVGTCKMAPENDSTGVVTPELKVKGIHNLRVIDGSIMPKIIGGNTNAPIVMIAEKGVDMILKKYGLKSQTKTKSSKKQEL